jgi:hypothetical protein
VSEIIILIPIRSKSEKKKSVVVDLIDDDLLEYNWHDVKGYAARYNPMVAGPTKIFLHQVILERKLGRKLLSGELVDHIDTKAWNNTRENLRLATNAENTRNRGTGKNSTSGYKGVHWNKKARKWCVKIVVNYKAKHLGGFSDITIAAKVYNEAAIKYHGAFAQLNVIPEEG